MRASLLLASTHDEREHSVCSHAERACAACRAPIRWRASQAPVLAVHEQRAQHAQHTARNTCGVQHLRKGTRCTHSSSLCNHVEREFIGGHECSRATVKISHITIVSPLGQLGVNSQVDAKFPCVFLGGGRPASVPTVYAVWGSHSGLFSFLFGKENNGNY